MNTFWTKDEVDYLISNYSDKTNLQISSELKRSLKSVVSKSRKLNLKKSKIHRFKMIGIRNKKTARDLSFEALRDIASSYKSRGEFQLRDASAYTTARTAGILDQICSHMIKHSYSIPQMILSEILKKIIGFDFTYNDKTIITPYEIDIFYYNLNLAFEYDGRGWHTKHLVDKNKLCLDKNITLITIVENSRRYIDDIKSQIIDNIDIINNNSGLDLKDVDIKVVEIDYDGLFSEILDEKEIKKVCDRYSHFSEFIKNNKNLYYKLQNLKLLNKFTSHMTRRGGINEESAKKEVSKYIYFSDFLKNSYRFYIWIKKNKKEFLLEPLKLKQNKKIKYAN
jgi:hypothetical protein